MDIKSSSKVKFTAIVFIGIFSIIFIYERIGINRYNNDINYIYHYINRSIVNSLVINSSLKSYVKPIQSPKHTIIYNKSKFESELYEIKSRISEFEDKYLVPILEEKPQNSRLLYRDTVKDIRHMT